ncbi:MAG TPA: AMP-binding protein, partial [Chthoniobacterales bacterium]|nr:AMP-binding protein [Chthoniobacterales bacterium]
MTKVEDPILTAWDRTRTHHPDRAAIFDSKGKEARTFLEIEDRARQIAGELEKIAPGQVLAAQIGNHPDWPSLFLACLRKQIVVLPLELTISDERKQNALEICEARAVVAAPPGGSLETSPLRTAASTEEKWGANPPALLKLTSGTTAAPRAVRFRSEQLLADCQNICET